MKRTRAGLLVVVAAAGVAIGFFIDQALTAAGRATFTPSLMLPILLVLLAAAVVLMALPIRRATHTAPGRARGHVDPFRAVRIAVLAKASSVVGAAVAGVGGGLLVFLLTRPVPPSLGSTGAVISAMVGGIVLVVGGLIGEHLCTIRKDDDDDQPGPAEPGFGLSHRD